MSNSSGKNDDGASSSSSSPSVFPVPSQTRLVTIVAQVDHGKTTLADSLIESNGIISERLAGTIRYLDSLEEEQRRGITMRTSAIGLRHSYQKQKSPKKKKQEAAAVVEMVIHLLDSPGHTDFAPEVSSALQCCDGALLVVDVVEGLSSRTHQVLREAHAHQLVPILVLNKVDRLCLDLSLTPTEAYLRLRKLLESVNAASAAMLNSKNAETTTNMEDDSTHGNDATASAGDNTDNDEEDLRWTFEPAKGNVVFCSALFGWGFSVPNLSKALFRQKIVAIKPLQSRPFLFGDFKYKDGKVLKWKGEGVDDAMPFFAEFALQPLWDIYEAVSNASMMLGLGSEVFKDGRSVVITKKDDQSIKLKAEHLTEALGPLEVGWTGQQPVDIARVLSQTGASSEESVLRALLRRYRPLSGTVLDAVCEHCPAPDVASAKVRSQALRLKEPVTQDEALRSSFQRVQSAVKECKSVARTTVAHVCKFLSTDRTHVRDTKLETASDTLLLGLARVLSGTLRIDQEYHCLGPKHLFGVDASQQRTIRLYLLMGNSFVAVDEVPAGHLCAIHGLEELQLKTVTLCNEPNGMPLEASFQNSMRPLVKVNIEPSLAEDMEALSQGLVKLSLADAAVEVTATDKGERILACLGEIHLEQSILDLRTVYCGKKDMDLRISEPIVEFAETTDWFENEQDFETFFKDGESSVPLRQTIVPPYNEEEGIALARCGRMRSVISGRTAAIRLRVLPLDPLVHASLREKKVLEGAEDAFSKLERALGIENGKGHQDTLDLLLDCLVSMNGSGSALLESKAVTDGSCVKGVLRDEIYQQLATVEDESEDDHDGGDTADAAGANEYHALSDSIRLNGLKEGTTVEQSSDNCPTNCVKANSAALELWKSRLRGSLVAGFDAGIRSGPVCEETIQQVMVVVEGVEMALRSTKDALGLSLQPPKPLNGGMVVSAMKRGIRCALLSRPVRLMEGRLKLTLHSSLNGLGPLYAVLSRRRGRVLEESMVDGTDLILITAMLPQAESFDGLASELLQKTSGCVTVPELTFWKWQVLDQDPFWIPTSLQEREDFGEIVANGDSSTGVDNVALKYIRQVRERKGLLTDSSKTVVAAEKQRTMKR